ncbi:MAG: CAP domain-containing protein [Anaerolineae bacterium]
MTKLLPLVLLAPVAMFGLIATRPAAAEPDGSVAPINTADRAAVVRAYRDVFEPTVRTDVGWTGDDAQCVVGDISSAFRDATETQHNYFRAMAGMRGDIDYVATFNRKAQAAALIMQANGSLDHSPPDDWRCLTADGKEGALNANLGNLGNASCCHIRQWMEDRGANNEHVMHRQYLLSTRRLTMGYGSTGQFGALWVFGDLGDSPPGLTRVSWPPAGYVPYRLVFPRWSLSVSGAGFTNATVTMTSAGRPVDLTVLAHDSILVWQPTGLPYYPGEAGFGADTTYNVRVTGLNGSAPATISYDVTLIDPAAGSPGPTPTRTATSRTATPPAATATVAPGGNAPEGDPICNCSLPNSETVVTVVNTGPRRVDVRVLETDCDERPVQTLAAGVRQGFRLSTGARFLVVDTDSNVTLADFVPWVANRQYVLETVQGSTAPLPGYSRVILDPPPNGGCDCWRWNLEQTQITIRNNDSGSLDLRWYQPDGCQPRFYSRLDPGYQVIQDTISTHTWQVLPAGGASAARLFDLSANANVPVVVDILPTASSPTPAPTTQRTATRTRTPTRSTPPSSTRPPGGSTPLPPTPERTGGLLTNLSTRGWVGTGDQVMIGGFIVHGGAVRVLLRALGPELNNRGVPGFLNDPVIELRDSSSVIARNDDWTSGSQVSAVRASGLAPNFTREPALLVDLQPGSYSLIVSGYQGGAATPSAVLALPLSIDPQTANTDDPTSQESVAKTLSPSGIALVEAYRVSGPGTLTNLSTRGQVGTGDNVMIGGFILTGPRRRVLLRAIGPDLGNRGVPGALADPLVQLFRGQTLILANDDWADSGQADELRRNGLAPRSNRESAMLLDLEPGAYSAIVRGYHDGTGIALVEAFALGDP